VDGGCDEVWQSCRSRPQAQLAGKRVSLPHTARRRLAGPVRVVAGQGDEDVTGGVVLGEADGDDLAVRLDDDRADAFIAVEGGGQDSAAAEAGVQGPVRVDPGQAEEAGAEEVRSAGHGLPVGLDGHCAGAVPRLVQAGAPE
jgi:hypothetical protein